ncbi:glycosyltransferase family 2 protein [Bifidobacterium jacchi]|uniref:Glycosyltransferase family 2 protein n=1 Tax=Bifidobacterium jacchi TaxID=2490545 RepID=A0A5N5RJI4_9BIFI|nr:glycosyltransferase family 2 protein [Bifidobacterium jacchi]KAB5607407.1 glycosyltransferase family 2 protein [Bifidobacterium jacchi]
MMSKTLVSIIVPVYGVERYLDRCIRSIVNQDYRELEIIVVDDGSHDACPRMCDEWAKRDARIRVIHKPNGGLASARNAGLDDIRGDYVTFVDSDDWVEPDYVSGLKGWMDDSQADVAMCATEVDYDDGTTALEPCATPPGCWDGDTAMKGFLYHRGFTGAVWGRMFDARLFRGDDGIRFYEGLNSEDYYVHVQVFSRMRMMIVQNRHLYHYCRRSDSITTSGVNEHTFDEVKVADLCVRYLEGIGYADRPAMDFFAMQGRADVMFSLFRRRATPRMMREYGRRIRAFAKPVLVNGEVSAIDKVRLLCLACFPVGYYRLQRLVGKV